jgi:multidrug resistance efflux pump
MLGVVTLHEFAHGLTCKHFGGHVREIGFMLIYFQPAFYCNVSEAWLFPEKSKRMWVTFAGGYFEVFLWAVATLIWRISDPSTSLNHFVLVVSATSAFKMFFNMNPLIKLDGYYLLSDWLEVPNLRQKAYNYLMSRIRRLAGVKTDQMTDDGNGKKWVLLVYAVLSTVYIYWLLSRIGLWFGNYMVSHYQGLGFIVFTAALGIFFRKPLGNAITPVTSGLQSRTPIKLRLPRPVKWIFWTGCIASALIFIRTELKVSGSFTVLPLHNADVRSDVSGTIAGFYADEGDNIEKGKPLAQLSNRDYHADMNKTRAEIEASEARLKLLKSGARPGEIELARMQVSKDEELYDIARKQLERDKQLADQQYISTSKFEETKQLATVREKSLEESKGKLKILLSGNRPEEIEATEADIRALEAHERYLEDQINALTVLSPVSGVVVTHKLKEKIGENIEKGDLIAEVFELKTVNVEIAIPEKEIGDVRLGQKLQLKARAYPHIIFEGKVTMIAPVANKPEEEWKTDRTVLVTSQLDNSEGLLKPEMTGNAKIHCGRVRLLDLVTRRFVRYFRVEFWSWW